MARQIVVELVADNKKFSGTMNAAGTDSEKFGSKFKSTATAVAKGAAIGGAAVAALATVFFDYGKDLEAMNRKAGIVFGDQMGAIDKWADANHLAMGLTKRELVGVAAGMQDLLVPMGFTREEATKLTTETMGLSGALAEWSAGKYNAAEVGDILTKAMLGEREQLKSLGISITEADVQQRLLKNGTAELTGEALAQAKAIATQQLIMEKSTDAQAAFAEGQDTGARASAKWGAKMRGAFETVTMAVYPLTESIGPMVMGVGSISKALGPMKSATLAAVGALGSMNVGTKLVTLAQKGAAVTSYALGAAVRFMTGPIGIIITAVGLLAGAWATNFGDIQGKTKAVIFFITGAFTNVVGFITKLPGRVASIAGRLWDSIPRAFKAAINVLIGVWNRLGFRVPTIDIPFVGKVGGFWVGVPKIPYMHSGGIVPGPKGSDQLAILQAGERVIPMNQAGGSGSGTVYINIESFTGSDRDIDQFADRLAMRLRLQGV